MTCCLRSTHLFLAAVCVWQAVAAGQFAHGQAEQTAQQQPASANSSLSPIQKSWRPNNLACYDHFFKYVGAEDDLIQQETQQGKQQTVARTDYSSAIGIDPGQVQAILAIVLDNHLRRVENKKQFQDAQNEYRIAQQRGTAQTLAKPDFQAFLNSDSALLDDTWLKVKRALPDEDYKKLDAYVSRQFLSPRYPGR
jgi:hypothetical protein